jgi:hypothetical protein
MEHREGGGSLPPDVHGSLLLNVLAGQRLKERRWFRSLRTNARCQQLLGDESRQLRKHVGQSGARRGSLLRRCRTRAILARLLMQLLFVLPKIDLLQHGSALLANVMVHELWHLLLESTSHAVSGIMFGRWTGKNWEDFRSSDQRVVPAFRLRSDDVRSR